MLANYGGAPPISKKLSESKGQKMKVAPNFTNWEGNFFCFLFRAKKNFDAHLTVRNNSKGAPFFKKGVPFLKKMGKFFLLETKNKKNFFPNS